MKYLKIFENNGEQVVLNAMNEYDRICDLMRDFINFEKLYNKEVKHVIKYYYETDVFEDGDNIIICLFGFLDRDGDDETSICLDEDDQRKFFKYVKNPELYMSAKKYNI